MNKIVTTDRTAASAVSMSHASGGSYLQAESLGDVVRFAELMCQSKAGIPQYLHGNAADCMAVTMQALQWSFNPFSVAQKSYKIKDVIAYEAQLIAAVINTRADLKRRPQYEFRGEGGERQCVVTFEFNDGSVQVYESPKFDKITPKNSPLWKTDPDQQQSYYSIRAGARRYCPEVILGAYDREEVEEFRGPDGARDVTPRPSVRERLQAASNATERPAGEQEGFAASSAQAETFDVLTGEILENEHEASDAAPSPGPLDVGDTPLSEDSTSDVSPEPEGGSVPQPEPSGSLIPETELMVLRRFARDVLKTAASHPREDGMKRAVERWIGGELKTVASEAGTLAVRSIRLSVAALMRNDGSVNLRYVMAEHAHGLSCDADELMGEPDNG